ncbi:hypothetical protein GCM10020229_26610 [Kitasatospora albolonga]
MAKKANKAGGLLFQFVPPPWVPVSTSPAPPELVKALPSECTDTWIRSVRTGEDDTLHLSAVQMAACRRRLVSANSVGSPPNRPRLARRQATVLPAIPDSRPTAKRFRDVRR